jgi:23S rRNA pseudouridine2604 synthase
MKKPTGNSNGCNTGAGHVRTHAAAHNMKPRNFDKPDRPFTKFRKDGPPRPEARTDGDRPFRKPFGRDPRAQFDDEQYTATGALADIVGTHPLDRREILRRMWRHYEDSGLVKSIGGGSPRPPRPRNDRPPFERSERAPYARSERPSRGPDDRPPRRFEDRPPRRFEGEREGAPRRYERKTEGGAPRRYGPKPEGGERRFSRDRDEGPKTYSRKPSQGPRVSTRTTRTPSGKHPAGKRAEAISKVPRRKFKETRE